MEQNFSSPRWYGRLLGLLLNLAGTKGIKFDKSENLTLQDLYLKVINLATRKEKEVINELLQKWSEQKKYEEANHISISESDENKYQQQGLYDVTVIFRKNESIDNLLEKTDFYVEEERRIAELKKKQAKNRRIVWGFVAAVILAIVIYNLPYFQEQRFYNEVVEAQSPYRCQSYYEEYPEGRHYEDVMLLEINLSVNPVKPMVAYLNKFPEGKYATEINDRYNTLWDAEIVKYENRDKADESPEAVKFLTEMLHHMKQHRINTIRLEINPTINLKDYEEYDENVRSILELFSSGETLPLKGNIVSLKENFTTGDQGVVKQILAEGVEKSFNRMFSSNLVSIVTSPEDADSASPVLTFNYVIKNSCDEGNNEIPNIWTYVANDKPQAYILAINVKFDVLFSIPGSDVTYTYSEIGEPGNEIRGIEDIKDGYRQMTQVCFAKFSDKMSVNLGLEKTYFREEGE